MPTFIPPHGNYGNAFVGDPLWVWYNRIDRGLTVLKKDGVYTVGDFPLTDDIDAADIVYMGGHIYQVDDTEAAALRAADLGDGLNQDVWSTLTTYTWGSLLTWVDP